MGKEVDSATVRHVAKLAHIAVTDAETEALVGDLKNILGYAAELQGLDLKNVQPTAHAVALVCPTRADEPRREIDPQSVISRAPEHEGTAFKVPKIIE